VRRLLPLLALLIAAFPASAAPVTVVDGLGRTVSLSAPASRVVSLSPACTEVLFAIGAADRVAGVTEYCDYPAEARKKPKVGGFSGKAVSIETLVALAPDLVVVEGQMHERVIAMLENARVPCYAADAQGLADAYRIIAQLGALTGEDSGARRVGGNMRERIDSVRRKTEKAAARPLCFWIVWDDPLMTAGRRTFIDEAIEAAGGRNAFADSREQYPTVSLESVIARKPDWILSGAMQRGGRTDAASLSARPGWRILDAVREGRVGFVDADSVNRAGPRLADAVEALAKLLHPEAFR